MRNLFLLALVLFLTPWLAGYAASSNFYQVVIPVATQSTPDKIEAMQAGLKIVLIRASANEAITEVKAIKSQLHQAENYVEAYAYTKGQTPEMRYNLTIHYDPPTIKQLLKRAGVSNTDVKRPRVLVWLTEPDINNKPMMIGLVQPGDVMYLFAEQAKQFGLPILFPRMDMGDTDHVTISDITEKHLEVLREAGKRYNRGAMLVGSIERADDLYKSKWQLVFGENVWDYDVTADTIQNVTTKVVSEVSATLMQYHTVKKATAPLTVFKLNVLNVALGNDLVAVTNYLKSLPLVKHVEINEIGENKAELSIQVEGTIQDFTTYIDNGSELKFIDHTNDQLTYKWVRSA